MVKIKSKSNKEGCTYGGDWLKWKYPSGSEHARGTTISLGWFLRPQEENHQLCHSSQTTTPTPGFPSLYFKAPTFPDSLSEMAISPTTPNHSSSQPLLPATQQLHTRIESQRKHAHHFHSSFLEVIPTQPPTKTRMPPLPMGIAGGLLLFTISYADEWVWSCLYIMRKLENPVQKKKSKYEPEDNSAGAEESIDDSSQQQLDVVCQSNSSSAVLRRRNRCPGKNGRTCHQCHQKTLDFVASCKSAREEMPCLKACWVQCIWNRYGDPLDKWRCPSCRGICNCGRCMKEKGFEPVGIRGRVGKTARFLSVMERLAANSSKNINEVVDHKETSATEENVPGSGRMLAVPTQLKFTWAVKSIPELGWRKRRVRAWWRREEHIQCYQDSK